MLVIGMRAALPLLLTMTLVGCAQSIRQSSAVQPIQQSSADQQFREIERKALKEASSSANQYAQCVMLSTLVYRQSSDPPSDIADALQAQCQDKLDAYEMWMANYYSATVERSSVEGQYQRARLSKEDVRQRMRQQAIQSIIDDRMKK